jgi:hypothetical protein
VEFGATATRVFTAEHLALIMLEVGRPKDRARLAQFLAENALDIEKLGEMSSRHHLSERWERFQRSLTE